MTDLHAELGSLSDIADGDQRSAAVVNVAADVAAFYSRLVAAGGMPKALIAELTMQAGHMIWTGGTCACDD